MRRKKNYKLKNLLQNAGIEELDSAFTKIIIKDVASEMNNVVTLDENLERLLKGAILEKAPPGITSAILNEVKKNEGHIIKPIIRLSTWHTISWATLSLVILLFSSKSKSHMSNSHLVDDLIIQPLKAIPTIYFITIVTATTLLLIDYLFRERKLL